MPKRKIHNKILDEVPFASSHNRKQTNNLNKWIDEPSQKYPGIRHRDFRHNPVKVARRFSGGSDLSYMKNLAIASGHVALDNVDHMRKKFLPKKKRNI